MDTEPPYIPALENDPVKRLINYSGPYAGIHHSTSVVALRAVSPDNVVVGTGSGLVIRYANGADGFRLLTARHIVAQARAARAIIHVEIIQTTNSTITFAITPVPIADGAWTLAEDDDLAVAILPAETLPEDHLVGSVLLEQLVIAGLNPTPDVQLIGRWGLDKDDNFVITRRGILATPQQPTVRFSIGDDKEKQQQPMYLVDAFVTRGMSGGAVFRDTEPKTVLGIISAHAQVPPPVETWSTLPPSIQTAAAAMWHALTPMNAGLVYVVPISRVLEFLGRIWPTKASEAQEQLRRNIATAERIRNWDKPPPA
jgi:hypothetical protein